MKVPGSFKKSDLVREVEGIRIKPGEVLLLRFTDAFALQEIEQFDARVKEGPLRNRVVCIRVPEEVEAFVVEAPK